MTSASLLIPGNTGFLAYLIQEAVGGNLFSIEVTEPYSNIFSECAGRAGEELETNARPALRYNVDNINDYDTVFIGYPVWANTCPMAVFSFIEENDLSGKTIFIFSAYGGGSMEKSISDIAAALPGNNVTIENTFGVSRADFADARENINAWLAGLELAPHKK